MIISIDTPPGFSFKRTVLSHGWYDLRPFHFDRETWTLKRVIDLGNTSVTISITALNRHLKIDAPAKSQRAASKIERDVRHMLRLDEDFGDFYDSVNLDTTFRWIAGAGAGRLLRSPTVFEDLVKMICTTNCSWALTDTMISRLVEGLGRDATGGFRDFPQAGEMARQPEQFYREYVRSGYRAPYLKELAERVASGELNVEGWVLNERPTDELRREMKKVKGVGDYAAENLLRLIGHYDGLALDSWVRSKFAETRNAGRKASDKKINRYYSKFGRWKGLALWCDMTRDWIQDDAE